MAQGFIRLREQESWLGVIKPGGKYFFTRNDSTLVAFTVGSKFEPGNPFKAVGAHTDSPVLKVKPISKRSAHGYLQVGVECYGGGLWHTWFDRELTVAGRVIIKNKTTNRFESKFVKVNRPILRIPNLCIHLQTGEERQAFKVNKEIHLQPIFSMVNDSLNDGDTDADLDTRHVPTLLRLLAEEIGCDAADIKDLELSLCDTQPGQIWGANNEFLSSPRLDNQVHCYTSMKALVAHAETGLESDNGISMIAMFDHEEVGSQSTQGACSPIFKDAIIRISDSFLEFANSENFRISLSKSLLLSADVAHAIHPNYASKHEQCHQPKLNGGTVLKVNDNQRYATDSVSGLFFRELARGVNQPVQEFVVRNDCPCGTTIGPIIAANTGIRTCDIGVPSLSMHSIRETIGVKDIANNYEILKGFFANYEALRTNFQISESDLPQ